MTHLDAERNGDAAVAPLLLAGGGLGRRRAWGGRLGRRHSLDLAAWARAVGCRASARDDFGTSGIGRR